MKNSSLTLAALAALAVVPLTAAAQTANTAGATTNTSAGTAQNAARAGAPITGVTVTPPRAPLARFPGDLDGLYARPALILSCRGQNAVAGPLPTPVPGSVEAQPGYQYLQDWGREGSCNQGPF